MKDTTHLRYLQSVTIPDQGYGRLKANTGRLISFDIYDVSKDGTLGTLFRSISDDIGTLCSTKEQAKTFWNSHKVLLRQTQSARFLTSDNDELELLRMSISEFGRYLVFEDFVENDILTRYHKGWLIVPQQNY